MDTRKWFSSFSTTPNSILVANDFASVPPAQTPQATSGTEEPGGGIEGAKQPTPAPRVPPTGTPAIPVVAPEGAAALGIRMDPPGCAKPPPSSSSCASRRT